MQKLVLPFCIDEHLPITCCISWSLQKESKFDCNLECEL